MAKNIALAALAGIVLLAGGFGAGYFVSSRVGAKSPVSPSASPSPTPTRNFSPTPSPTASVPEDSSIPAGWSICSNPVEKFSIGYPGGWVTHHVEVEDACNIFDPESFVYPPEGPSKAMAVILQTLTVDEVVEQITDTPNSELRVLRKEENKLDSRRAVIIETEATGQGDDPARTMRYDYVIDRDGRAFSVIGYAQPSRLSRYPEFRSVVDQSVKTLNFLGAAPSPRD